MPQQYVMQPTVSILLLRTEPLKRRKRNVSEYEICLTAVEGAQWFFHVSVTNIPSFAAEIFQESLPGPCWQLLLCAVRILHDVTEH